jgi:hypothetical protein
MIVASLLTTLGLVGLAQGAAIASSASPGQIKCYAPMVKNGIVYYGSPTVASYTNQIGVVDAYGNAPLLAQYPNQNVDSLKVNAVPCTSKYLNYTGASIFTNHSLPVILFAADGSSDCLQLQSSSATNVFIVKQSCDMTDGPNQTNQFWTKDLRTGSYMPTGSKQPAAPWNLQFNDYDSIEVLANPPNCPTNQICQNDQHIAFYVK